MLAILILAAAALVAALLETPLPPVSGMARASDGDSFRLDDQRIRLLGLDALELDQTCTDGNQEQWSCGEVARDRLAALLGSGTVVCQPHGHDQYGRLLARCTIGSIDPAQVIVSEGLAVSSGDYWREEQDARATARGIWAGSFERPQSWREDHFRRPRFFDWLLR